VVVVGGAVVEVVVVVVVVVVGGIAGIDAQKRASTASTSGSGAPNGVMVPFVFTNTAGEAEIPVGAAGSGVAVGLAGGGSLTGRHATSTSASRTNEILRIRPCRTRRLSA
jgi:hypothetical protein